MKSHMPINNQIVSKTDEDHFINLMQNGLMVIENKQDDTRERYEQFFFWLLE